MRATVCLATGVLAGALTATRANARFQQSNPHPAPQVLRVLVMNDDLRDQRGVLLRLGAINTAFSELDTFLRKASFGKFSIEWDVINIDIGPFVNYQVDDVGTMQTDLGRAYKVALEDSVSLGVNIESYDAHCLLSDVKPNSTGGNGFPGLKFSSDMLALRVLGQELIHSFNVSHSTGLRDPLAGSCPWDPSHSALTPANHLVRGNIYDVMGSSTGWEQDGHPNVRIKNYFGWLPDDRVVDVTTSGTYTIYQQDELLMPAAGQMMALRIHKDAGREYWVEFRQRISGSPSDCAAIDTNVDTGALVYLCDKGWRYTGAAGPVPYKMSMLLDMHDGPPVPASCSSVLFSDKYGWADAALQRNQTFCDPSVGAAGDEIRITPTGITTPGVGPASITLEIVVPPVSSSWSPTDNGRSEVIFLDPRSTVKTFSNSTVTVTAQVTDPDGPLSQNNIDFELYRTWDETPFIDVKSPGSLGNDVWSAQFTGLEEGGYILIVEVIDADGRMETFGTFFFVDLTP